MLNSAYIHKITIVRWANTGQDAFGSQSKISSSSVTGIPATGIPCRVETYQEKREYRDSGERSEDKTIIYIPPQYTVLLSDDVYYNGEYLGIIVGINPALKGTTKKIDHYELEIEDK